MGKSIVFRPAAITDAPQIVDIIRQGFPEKIMSCMIYGCDGITRFISHQIALPASDTVFALASTKKNVLGCMELRLLLDRIFLNYIVVRKAHCGIGIGRSLLAYGLQQFGRPWHWMMQLDVFKENEVARRWYEKLNFKPETENVWLEIPPSHNIGSLPEGRISGLPQADVCHQAFGFSQFCLTTPRGTYNVGRLSDSWYRITDPKAFADPSLLPSLACLDQNRFVLAILPAENIPPLPVNSFQQMTRSERMTISIDKLATALE